MNVLKKLFKGDKVAPMQDLDTSEPFDDVWYKIREILPLVHPVLAESLQQAQLFGDYKGMQRLLQKGLFNHQHVDGYENVLQKLSVKLLTNSVRTLERSYAYEDVAERNEPARARRRARIAAQEAQTYGDSYHGGRKSRKRRTHKSKRKTRKSYRRRK